MTTTIGNARLADGRSVDLDIDDEGCITAVRTRAEGAASGPGALDYDLGGWLLLPAMAEPHAHLDKALTADMVPNPKGDLMGAIDAWIAAAGE